MCISENQNVTRKSKRKRKHIPHAQRPSEFVERRNRRERNRIRAVNEGFKRLRRKLPSCGQDPEVRISKMEVLTNAIGYIEYLCRVLGYRDFVDYCRDVQSSGMKENFVVQAPQVNWNAVNNGPYLPLRPVGLRERPTNTGPTCSHAPWRLDKPVSSSSPRQVISRDQSLHNETYICETDTSIPHITDLNDSFNIQEFQTFNDFEEICCEQSYSPCNHGLSFQHLTYFNPSVFPHSSFN
ncbi:achaete-scute homolog 2-like [Saccostrea cucullata]|uniref:achaete-scute homolog 2-like n=1 Tax=Saccostrea cuccullata TaxID=36930 RepID=UPI002ED106E2